MILSYIPGEALCEEDKLEALVHVEVKPHVNKPLGTTQVTDGLAEQEFLSYLVEGGGKLHQADIGREEIGHHWLIFLLLPDRQKLVLPIDHRIRICPTTCSGS